MSQFNTFYTGECTSVLQTQNSEIFLEPRLDELPGVDNLDLSAHSIAQKVPLIQHQQPVQNLNEPEINLGDQHTEDFIQDVQQVITENMSPTRDISRFFPPSKRPVEYTEPLQLINVTPIVHENINGLDVVEQVNLHESVQIEEPPQVTENIEDLETALPGFEHVNESVTNKVYMPVIPESKYFKIIDKTDKIQGNPVRIFNLETIGVSGIPINKEKDPILYEKVIEEIQKDELIQKNNLILTPENTTLLCGLKKDDHFSVFLTLITTLNAIKLVLNGQKVDDLKLTLIFLRESGKTGKFVPNLGIRIPDTYDTTRFLYRQEITYEKVIKEKGKRSYPDDIKSKKEQKKLKTFEYKPEEQSINIDDVNLKKMSFIGRDTETGEIIFYFRAFCTTNNIYYCITSWVNDDKQFIFDTQKRYADLLGKSLDNPYLLLTPENYNFEGKLWKEEYGGLPSNLDTGFNEDKYTYDSDDTTMVELVKWADRCKTSKQIIDITTETEEEPEVIKDYSYSLPEKIKIPIGRKKETINTIERYEVLQLKFRINIPVQISNHIYETSRYLTINELTYVKTMISMFAHILGNIQYTFNEWTPESVRRPNENPIIQDLLNDGVQLPPIEQGYQENVDQTINDSAKN